MQDLFSLSREAMQHAREYTEQLEELGRKKAEADRDYQVAKNKRVLAMKAEGRTATEINLLIKGDKDVSVKLFARDCAESLYDATKELINTNKMDARLLEAQIAREWNQSGQEF